MEECCFYSSMGVFHVLKFVRMVPNREKYLIWNFNTEAEFPFSDAVKEGNNLCNLASR